MSELRSLWWKRLGVALASSVHSYLRDSQSSVEELTGREWRETWHYEFMREEEEALVLLE